MTHLATVLGPGAAIPGRRSIDECRSPQERSAVSAGKLRHHDNQQPGSVGCEGRVHSQAKPNAFRKWAVTAESFGISGNGNQSRQADDGSPVLLSVPLSSTGNSAAMMSKTGAWLDRQPRHQAVLAKQRLLPPARKSRRRCIDSRRSEGRREDVRLPANTISPQ